MPRPIPVRQIVKVLQSKGFFFVSQTGSHAKYRKPGFPTLNAIVPIHEKEVRYGTFRSILRQSRLDENDFMKKISQTSVMLKRYAKSLRSLHNARRFPSVTPARCFHSL